MPLWHHHDPAGATCAHADHACTAPDHDAGGADAPEGGDDPDGGDDCVVCKSLATGKHIVPAAPIARVVAVAAAALRVSDTDGAVAHGRRFGRPHPRGPPLDS